MRFSTLLLLLFTSHFLSAQVVDFVTDVSGPSGMTTSGNTIFFSQYLGGTVSLLDVTDPELTVVDISTGLGNPYGVTLHNGFLYYADVLLNHISRIELGGSGNLPEIVVELESPSALFVHDSHLYFSQFGPGNVYRLNLNQQNAPIDTIARGLSDPAGLHVLDNELYIAEFSSGQIIKLPLDNLSSTPSLVLTELDGLNHLASADGILYIGNFRQNRVLALDVGAGATEASVLIPDLLTPTGIAVIDNQLYVGAFDLNKIVRLDLPTETEEPSAEHPKLRIYPNPCLDQLWVDNWTGSVAAQIVNAAGQIIRQTTLAGQEPISVVDLPAGTYWLLLPGQAPLSFVKR